MENKFKRFLSLMLAVVMVIGMMPMNVFAVGFGDESVDTVIDTADELQAALEAGGEVVLGGNISGDTNSLIAFTVPAGVDATLDLNGYTLLLDANYCNPLMTNNGTLTIQDSSVNGTGVMQCNGNALCIQNNGTLVINGGSISGFNSPALECATGENVSVVINGGTFYASGRPCIGEGSAESNIVINGGTFESWVYARQITGGTFQTDVSSMVAEGYEAVDNSDGTWTVRAVAADVAKVGEMGYTSLQDAINAADGKVITVVADIDLGGESVRIPAGTAVTLDLNGYTISGVCNANQAYLITIENTAKLTIKDTSDPSTGKITYGAGTSNVGFAIDVKGDLILESGTIELTGSWSLGFAVDVRPNAWGAAYTDLTTFVMNGGKIVSSDTAVRVDSNSSDAYEPLGVYFTMNGGVIESDWDAIFIQHRYANDLFVTVNGGSVSGKNSPLRIYGDTVVSDVELTITGGSFDYTGEGTTGWIVENVLKGTENVVAAAAIAIFGGTFEGDVSAYLAEGYELTTSTDTEGNTVYGVRVCGHSTHNTDGICDCGKTVAHSYVRGSCSVCGAADPDYEAPVIIGYTSTNSIWGEVGGDAWESFEIRILDADDNVMGTTSLNNIDGIIDGDVYVTWNIQLDAESNTDDYWTMSWTNAPSVDLTPAKVELWIDGDKVSSGNVVLNGPDDLNKIYAATVDADGRITQYHTSLSDAVTAADGGTVCVLRDVTESIEAIENITLVTNVEDGVTVTNTYSDYLDFNNVTLGSGVTLNTPNVLSSGSDSVNVIEGTVNVSGVYYHRYDAKTTVQNGGKVTTGGMTVMRYNTDPEAGIYIYGDGDGETVEFSCGNTIGAYSGTFYAEDAVVEGNMLWLDYKKDGSQEPDSYPVINAQFENSVLNVASELRLYQDATLTLNGTTVTAGKVQIRQDADPTVKMDSTSVITASAVENLSGAKLNAVLGEDGTITFDVVLDGTGTDTDPYVIYDVDDLFGFAKKVNEGETYSGKYVKLGADIDLDGEAWTPIGTNANPFKGTFDGDDHTISNLVVNGGSKSNQGFFGFTRDGAVKNLTIEHAEVSGRLNVGVVAGTPYTSTYTNITVIGHVEVNGMAYVGGAAGKNAYADWTDITIDVDSDSYVNANSVEDGVAYRTYVGGVIGFNGEGSHTFKNVSSNIKVIGSTSDIGGLFGIAHYGNNFDGVTFTGSVEAPADAKRVGGIAGVWHNEVGYEVTFDNVTSTGTVAVGGVDVTETSSIVGGAYYPANDSSENSGELVIEGKNAWIKAAKIGETKYVTLEEAAAAAQANDEIVLLEDVTLSEALTLPAGITLNGNGKQIDGTIYAGGDLTFAGHTKVTSFSATYYNRVITIGEGACLEITGTGRVTLAYGNTFNITGTITDAKTADKADVQASLIIPGGMSITGGNDAAMNVTNAYVKIGNTSSKNSATNGKFALNFTNSIVEFTNQFTLSEPTSGMAPTFELTIKDSVVTTGTKMCIAAPDSTVVIDNSVVTLNTYLRNSGEMTLKNGSVLTGSTIQFGENGGNNGTITVDASELTINATSTGHALDGKGEGTVNVVNGGKVNIGYLTNSAINVDTESQFTTGQILGTSSVVIDAENYDGTSALNINIGTTDVAAVPVTVVGKNLIANVENGVVSLIEAVALVGENKYLTVQEALRAAIDAGASEVKILKDVREKMAGDFDININADLTITADQPVKVEFYNEGTSRDFAVGSTNNNKLTIAENVHFDLTDRVIWLGYWGNNVDVQVDGYLGGYQIWHGADTTVSSTGTLDSHGEAFIMRRDATLTVRGGTVNANYFHIYSGHINATGAEITAGLVWIVNNHDYGTEGTVSMALDNTTLTSNGEIKVSAGEGKTVAITLSNGSIVDAAGALTADDATIITADSTSSFVARNASIFTAIVNDTQYVTLQAAVDAAAAGDTVKLTNDVVLTETLVIPQLLTRSAAGVTLDLNGKTISQSKACTGSYSMIENNGILTITGNGKISFTDTGAGDPTFGWGSYTITNRGTLVVENGTIEHLGAQDFATHMICAIQQSGGTTTINGGTISTPNYRSVRVNKGDLIINGGTFDGQIWLQPNQGDATLTVTGGTFEPNGRDASAIFMTNAGENYTVSSASITGGTFNGKIGATNVDALTGTIAGGIFSETAAQGTNTALLGVDFEFIDNGDGTYTPTFQYYLAQVGNKKYVDFTEALKALTSGATLTLLQNVTITENWDNRSTGAKITVPVTIDGNGKTIKFTSTVDDRNYFAAFRFEADATVKNLTIDMSEAQGISNRFRAISAKANLTVDNCTFIGNPNVTNTRAIIFGEGSGAANIGNVTVSVTGSTFINWRRGLGDNENAQNAKSVTATCNTFTNASVNVSAAEDVTFTGNTVAGGSVTITSYNDLIDNVTVTGNILTDGATGTVKQAASYDNIQDEFGKVAPVVVTNGSSVTYFSSLTAAVAAAQEGDVIELQAGTFSEGTVKLPAALKNVTIKGTEGAVLKDMTIMAADGSSISYEGLTFDGIAFENSRISITGWRTGGVTVKDLTVTNCVFKNLDDTTNSAPVHINMDASEAVENFTFTNNVIDGATGGQKSGVYAQTTGRTIFTGNTINNVSFRPYVIQLTSDDGIADEFIVTGNTFSGSAAGRAQALANNAEGTDTINLVVSGNIFKDITSSQQICYWNFNPETTTADLSRNYYDIDILNNPSRIYFNSAASNAADLLEKGVYPYYADEEMTTEVHVPAVMVIYADDTIEYFDALNINAEKADGAVITLLTDINVDTETITIADGKSVTLDLHGNKITVTDNKASGNYELFYIYGELTVTGNGTIELTSATNRAWGAMSAIFHNRGGVLTIENGTFRNLGGTDMAWVVDNSANYYGDATTNILDGTLTSTYTAIRNRMEQNAHGASGKAILNVSGGTIDGTTSAVWAQAASVSETAPATGEINISGGNIGLINTARSSGAVSMTTITGGTVAAFKGEVNELKVVAPGAITGNVIIMDASGNEVDYIVTADGLYTYATAKIGNVCYENLADAFAAARNGDVVEILLAGTYALTTSGKDITITGAVDGVEFANIGERNMDGANITFNNVTFTYADDSTYKGLQHAGNMVYNDCTINGQVFLYGESETFNGCTFNQTSVNYNVWTYGAKEVVFNNCTFNSAGKSVLIYAEGASITNDVTVTQCTFYASAAVDGKAAIEMDSSLTAGITLTIDADTTATGFDNGNVSGNSLWNNKKGNEGVNNDITVTVGDQVVLEPIRTAAVNGVVYTTLEAALAAAQAGQTVTLLADINVSEIITLDKAITLDGSGKTLTSTAGRAINVDCADTVTIENLNIVGDSGCERGINIINKAGTTNLNNMTVTGVSHYAVHVAISAGAATVNISGGSYTSCGALAIYGAGTTVNVENAVLTGINTWEDNGSNNFSTIALGAANVTINVTGGTITAKGETGTAEQCIVGHNSNTSAGSVVVLDAELVVSGTNAAFLRIHADELTASVRAAYGNELASQGYAYKASATDGMITVTGPAVASIDGFGYATLAAAIAAAQDGDTVKLLADSAENITVHQAPDVKITIDGDGKTMTGTITVDGKSAAYATAGLTIKNVNFDASATTADACIKLGGNNNIRYTSNVTIENCTFTGTYKTNGAEKVAVKSYTGGDKNLTITGCTATGMHSLLQVKNVEGVTISGCSITDSKNGISLGASTGAVIEDTTINASGYGIRADGSGEYDVTVRNVTIDAELPIVVRKNTAAGYELKLEGTNNLTGSNAEGYQVIITAGDDGSYDAPTVAIDLVGVENTNVYPAYVAKIGDCHYATLEAAITAAQAGETVTLLKDIELAATQNISKSITIDGAGYTITQAAGVATDNHALLYLDNSSAVTVKNVTFDGINGSVIRSVGADVTIDSCVFQNGTHTGHQGIVRLNIGDAVITNSQFLNNTCTMAVSFNYDAGNADDTLVIDNCKFEGNTANDTALVYYVKGAKAAITDSDFVDNTVNTSGNGATIYLGFTENNVVTGNLFQNNRVISSGTSTRVGGTLFFGYEADVSGNAFVSNTATNANGDALGQVCVSTFYECEIDLSGNYWSGREPVYGEDYTLLHQTGDATFVLDNYYTAFTRNPEGGVVLSGMNEAAYVAQAGKRYYSSLVDAIAAAQNGETVTVLADIAISESAAVAAGKSITLDLNGKTVAGTDTTAANFGLIQNNGTLTITDSVGDGKITVTATTNSGWNRYSAVISNNPGGTLVVNNGTIEHLGGTDMAYGIDSLTNGNGGNVSVTINGGTVKSTYRAIRQFLNSTTCDNVLTINGGTVEGTNNGVFFHDPSTKANKGTITIGENATVSGVYLFVTAGSTEWPVNVAISGAAVNDNITWKNVPNGYDVAAVNGIWGVHTGIAKIGEVYYATVAEAMAAALIAGTDTTVTLIDDAQEALVIVYGNVTLDLNGHALTTSHFITLNGSQVKDGDNGTTGIIKVPQNCISIQESNILVPVWDPENEGYIFTSVKYSTSLQYRNDENNTIRYMFLAKPQNSRVVELLKDGALDNQIQIKIVMTWITDTADVRQDFVYRDATISNVYTENTALVTSGRVFYIDITGYENLADLTVQASFASVLGAEDVSNAKTIN